MKEDISSHIWRRDHCPVCRSKNLSDPIPPYLELQFPLLPLCIDQPRSEDNFAPFTICLCQQCGLILLRDVVDPDLLYRIFHSDGIGKMWDQHYERFAELIRAYHKQGRVAEIGAGQGRLIRKLLPHYTSGVEVIDPQYEGPREGVVVHDQLLDDELAATLNGSFDSVVSSHTLEHFIEFNQYFSCARTMLKDKGLLFTSVPNQEFGFAKGYPNQMNFEHPSLCSNLHWLYLHYRNGFLVKEIVLFHGHSIMIVAQKSDASIAFDLNGLGTSRLLADQHTQAIMDRIRKVREAIVDDKENWLFGGTNFSQILLSFGLEESRFAGVLDNSPHKHGKRLYGFSLICRKPEDIVGRRKNLRVFVNLGHYNEEVAQQLRSLDADAELVLL